MERRLDELVGFGIERHFGALGGLHANNFGLSAYGCPSHKVCSISFPVPLSSENCSDR
jgi:hypothetical protein